MRKRNEKGFSFYLFFLVIVVVIGSVVWWKNNEKNQRQEQARAAKLLEEQARQFRKKEFEKAVSSLGGVYARFEDTFKLANHTSRIALAGPVGRLQEIKREAASLTVPSCLAEAKKKMMLGMDEIIGAFIQFMKNEEASTALSITQMAQGKLTLSEYETAVKACVPE